MIKFGFLALIAFQFLALPQAFARNQKRPAICYTQPGSTACYKARLKQHRKKNGVSDDLCSKHSGLKGCKLPTQKKVQKTSRRRHDSYTHYSSGCKNALIRTRRQIFLSSREGFPIRKVNTCVDRLGKSQIARLLNDKRKNRKTNEDQLSNKLKSCIGESYSCDTEKAFEAMDRFNACGRVTMKVINVSKALLTSRLNKNCLPNKLAKEELEEDNWTNLWGILR